MAPFTSEWELLREWAIGSPERITIHYNLDDNSVLDDVPLDASTLLHAAQGSSVSTLVTTEVYNESSTAPTNSYTVSLADIR